MKTDSTLLFKQILGIDYFDFERDFIERNVRCIPMIVRFKMDRAGIKLKLSEWSQFRTSERIELALRPCSNEKEARLYHEYLSWIIRRYTDGDATGLEVDQSPGWAEKNYVPPTLQNKAAEFGWHITAWQWEELTDLQRFALLKLCRPGHESKNFPKAMKEFGLSSPKRVST